MTGRNAQRSLVEQLPAMRGNVLMHVIVTDDALLKKYVPPPMEAYFSRKLPDIHRGELRIRIVECLKFLTLFHFAPGEVFFSTEIDDIWHYWILQTREYADLCTTLPSGKFLHHSSFDYSVERERHANRDLDRGIDRLVSFFASYVYNFGPMEEHRLQYWPALQMLMTVGEWNLTQVNAYLQNESDAPIPSLEAATARIDSPAQSASKPQIAGPRPSTSAAP